MVPEEQESEISIKHIQEIVNEMDSSDALN